MIFIDNFEQDINYVIVGRGKNYFQNGAITEFKMNNNEVYAVVSGTEDYEVNMQNDDSGNIISSYCDCPYDMGEFCKHEVAVMYAIREFCNNNNNLKSSKNTLEELLLSQPIEVLTDIICDLVKNNYKDRERLILQLSEHSSDLDSCIKLIWKYINLSKSNGILLSEDLDYALEGAYRVIKMADEMADKDYLEAAKRYITVIDIVTDLDVGCIDYDWWGEDDYICHTGFYNEDECACPDEIIDIVFCAIDKLGTLAEYDTGNRLFEILLNKMNGDVYNCYYRACMCFCERKENRSIIEKMISKIVSSDEILRFRYELINRYDGKECEYSFLEKHIDMPEFRDLAITNAMNDNDYERAVYLIEGNACKQHFYYDKWQKIALNAHEHLGNTEKVKEYMIRFIKDGELDFNEKLKAICGKDEWNSILRTILDELKISDSYYYEKLLIKEEQYTELFLVCKKHKKILEYYQYFINSNRNEAIDMYFEECIKKASTLSGRSSYNRLCTAISDFGKCYGLDEALKIIECLKNNHKRQPAFIDELCTIERKLKKFH